MGSKQEDWRECSVSFVVHEGQDDEDDRTCEGESVECSREAEAMVWQSSSSLRIYENLLKLYNYIINVYFCVIYIVKEVTSSQVIKKSACEIL